MASTLKTIVSKKKLRYVEGRYNLDLSYINDRIIAMGYPAEHFEAVYRNNLDDVKKFLDEKHKDHYMIYNLCSERMYDKNKFDGRVCNYPFDDHNPPDFAQIKPFCEDVKQWLDKDDKNVAAVHCKAGKGRTGVMICCYLLHCGQCRDAREVIDFYAGKRTSDKKGVTIPSQKRYIHYYDRLLNADLDYQSVKLYLSCVVLDPVPDFASSGTDCYLSFVVTQRRRDPYQSRWYALRRSERQVRLEVEPPLLISDDVKIEFSTKPRWDFRGILPKPKKKMNTEFHFWFNTFFLNAMMNGSFAHDILSEAKFFTPLKNAESWSAPNKAPVLDSLYTAKKLASKTASMATSGNPFFTEEEEEAADEAAAVVPGAVVGVCRMRRLSHNHDLGLAGVCSSNEEDDECHDSHHHTVMGMPNLVHVPAKPSLSELLQHHSISGCSLLQHDGQGLMKPDLEALPAMLEAAAVLKTELQQHNAVDKSASSSLAESSSSSSASLCAAAGCKTAMDLSQANAATVVSFSDKRTRHASVPQTASSPGTLSHLHQAFPLAQAKQDDGHNHKPRLRQGYSSAPSSAGSQSGGGNGVEIEGTNLSLRLNKSQIDKAAKDKKCTVYHDTFNVTLFLSKPFDQSDNLPDLTLNTHRQISVTPVKVSASTSSCVGLQEDYRLKAAAAQHHRESAPDHHHHHHHHQNHLQQHLNGKKGSGLANLFNRKAESSSEDEISSSALPAASADNTERNSRNSADLLQMDALANSHTKSSHSTWI